MINTNIISAEASATTNSGVAAKGKQKGKSQSLFSKLIATLQHGSQNQSKNTSFKASDVKISQLKPEEAPTSHDDLKNNKAAKKTSTLLAAPITSDKKNSRPKDGMELNTTDASGTIIAIAQQAALVPQTVTRSKVSASPQPTTNQQSPPTPLTVILGQQNTSNKDTSIATTNLLQPQGKNIQYAGNNIKASEGGEQTSLTVTLAQQNTSNKGTSVATPNPLQSQDKNIQHESSNVKVPKAERQTPMTVTLAQQNTSNKSTSVATPNPQQSQGKNIQQAGNNIKTPEAGQQTSTKQTLLLSQNSTARTVISSKNAQTPSNPTFTTTNQAFVSVNTTAFEKLTPSQKAKSIIPANPKATEVANTPALTSESKVIVNEKQILQASQPQAGNKEVVKENDISPANGKQVPLIPTQQRTPTQEQASSPLLVQSTSIKSMDNNSSSQQDFASSQQNVNTSALDMDKTNNKTHGVDFQAQLAYRSQRTFTPSDTMLAIVKSAKNGSTSLELQLEPVNLGKVQVSIQIDAQKQIQVAFTVDQNSSRQALEQHMPQLRLALAQQGLDLGGFTMQMNQQNQPREQSSSTHHSNMNDEYLDDVNLEISQKNRIGVNIATDGRLNILA